MTSFPLPQPTVTTENTTFILVGTSLGADLDQHSKRQSGSFYVSNNGTMTTNCSDAPTYSLQNGALSALSDGVQYIYSTSPGVPYQPFSPSTIPGSITTTFSFGSNGVLFWQNDTFFNGQASFCSLSNGTVYAVFEEGVQPQGCFFLQLSLYSVSSCQALSLATATGPSGWVIRRLSGGESRYACHADLVLVRAALQDHLGKLISDLFVVSSVRLILLQCRRSVWPFWTFWVSLNEEQRKRNMA